MLMQGNIIFTWLRRSGASATSPIQLTLYKQYIPFMSKQILVLQCMNAIIG